MKKAQQLTTAGLVLRLVALKAQGTFIKARRAVLREELLRRLARDMPIILSGYRVVKKWRPERQHTSITAAGWEIRINKPWEHQQKV
jgi:hypothetical protein